MIIICNTFLTGYRVDVCNMGFSFRSFGALKTMKKFSQILDRCFVFAHSILNSRPEKFIFCSHHYQQYRLVTSLTSQSKQGFNREGFERCFDALHYYMQTKNAISSGHGGQERVQ